MASQQIDDQKAEHNSRLQRIKALALHLNHNKTFAQNHHRCCTCDRPLNPATELAPFIQKQVCHTACAAWIVNPATELAPFISKQVCHTACAAKGFIDSHSSGCPVACVAQAELLLHWQATA